MSSEPVRVLTVEEVALIRSEMWLESGDRGHDVEPLCDSHEALRTQLAEAERRHANAHGLQTGYREMLSRIATELGLDIERDTDIDAIMLKLRERERTGWRKGLEEAIAEVDAATFSDMGVGGGWLKGPKQLRPVLERLRDTDPAAPERGGQS